MDGVHDLGGKPGFGAVDFVAEDAAVPFKQRWHASVFAMVRAGASAGVWTNSDRFRHAIERIDPEAYLTHGYYGRWLGGVETLLAEQAVVLREEIDSKVAELGGDPEALVAARPLGAPDPLGPEPVNRASDRAINARPQFSPGDRVRTRAAATPGHTRLPAYARDKVGTVVRWHDGWVYPDTNAHGQGEQPTHLYTVAFTSEVLWDRTGFSVFLDLFEPYLTHSDARDARDARESSSS